MRRLIFFILAFPSLSFGAQPAVVQCGAQYSYSTGVTLTLTAGNAVVVCASADNATPNYTATDGVNTYTTRNHGITVNGQATGISASFAVNVAGGSTTIQLNNSSGDLGMTACEVSGIVTSSALDISTGTTSGAGASTTFTSNAMTTSFKDFIFDCYANEASGSEVSAGTGYTKTTPSNTNHFDGMQYSEYVSAGSQAPFFTGSSTNQWIKNTVALKAADQGSAAAPAPRRRIILAQ